MSTSTRRIEVRDGRSLCARARRMIDAGADPAQIVIWTRGGNDLFKPATLATWAAWHVREDPHHSVSYVRFQSEGVTWLNMKAEAKGPRSEG